MRGLIKNVGHVIIQVFEVDVMRCHFSPRVVFCVPSTQHSAEIVQGAPGDHAKQRILRYNKFSKHTYSYA